MAASAHAVPLGKLHCFAKTGACPGCRVFVPDSASGNLLARWEFRDVWCRCHSSPKLASKNLSRHVNELEAIWSSTCDEYLPGQGGDFPRLQCGVNNKGRPARGTLGGHDYHMNSAMMLSMLISGASEKRRSRKHRRLAGKQISDFVDKIVESVSGKYNKITLPLPGSIMGCIDANMASCNIDIRVWWTLVTATTGGALLDSLFREECEQIAHALIKSRDVVTIGSLLAFTLVHSATNGECLILQATAKMLAHQVFNVMANDLAAVLTTTDEGRNQKHDPQKVMHSEDCL